MRPSDASSITPQLYISDIGTAHNNLEELGITHVVSLLHRNPHLPNCVPPDKRLHIKIMDKASSDILKFLETTTAFITAAINADTKNKVLVCPSPELALNSHKHFADVLW
jgi:atypical dual specificity phosphatase